MYINRGSKPQDSPFFFAIPHLIINCLFTCFPICYQNKMSPIPRAAVKFTQRIKNQDVRKKTLTLIEMATMQPDLSHFTGAVLK
ncbi:hypothetical protein GGR57DRAFT_487883 [Xylariaceae sp. FL1272]|nr:hypothetical protein GGR57DRAFT_487883 [Xylariaceae sp. FL1272]